jgi:NADH-quinone oxidoreductase subunit L
MFLAVGVGAYSAAIFHMVTHAFFKALLFLGAGSVIHAMHHEQDIWKMGALRKKMPVTFWTFLVGTLALCGVPPFSGFYSKDSILAQAFHHAHEHPITGWVLFAVAVFVAFLTTFYMFRLVFVAFYGEAKSHAVDHAHESPGVMVWPLRILAVLAIFGGVIGINSLFDGQFAAEHTTEQAGSFWEMLPKRLIEPFHHSLPAALMGIAVTIVGFFIAKALYGKAKSDPLPAKLGILSRAMANRFYFDEFYEATVIRIHDAIAAVSDFIDRWIVEGFCIGLVRGGTDLTGRALRLAQTGNLQTYAFLFVLGVAVVLWFVLGK